MEKPDQRNFIIAMVLMLVFVFGYQKFVLEPQAERYRAEHPVTETETGEVNGVPGVALPSETAPVVTVTVIEALSSEARVKFEGPGVDGSIRLAGARIDDLSLRDYFKTVERKEEVRLFRPENAEFGYFATYYWHDSFRGE